MAILIKDFINEGLITDKERFLLNMLSQKSIEDWRKALKCAQLAGLKDVFKNEIAALESLISKAKKLALDFPDDDAIPFMIKQWESRILQLKAGKA